MTARMKFAFWSYLVLMAAGAAWGIGFLLRSEFTPYHSAAAAGVPWSEVPVNFQIVILALTKLAGGLWVAFTLCIFVLLFLPFRQGARWTLRAVPLLMLAQYVAPMPAMIHLTTNTPATPPGHSLSGALSSPLLRSSSRFIANASTGRLRRPLSWR